MSGAVARRARPASAGSRSKRRVREQPKPALDYGDRMAGFQHNLVLVLVLIGGLIWGLTTLTDTALSDEGYHWSQIQWLLEGGSISPHIPQLPGYHLVMTYLMKALSLESIHAGRGMNWFLSFLGLALFYRLVRKSGEGNPSALALQLYLSPIIFPFFCLVYTDVPAMSVVLLSLLLTLNRNYRLAALVAGASVLFRQTNIMWLFLFWMLALSDTGFFNALKNFKGFKDLDWKGLADPLLKTYIFPVLCLVFLAFVIINRGVAVGDASMHNFARLFPTQIFMFLFALFCLFLPMHIKNAPAIWRLLTSRPVLPFLGALLYGFYMATFWADNGYNHHSFYMRNWLLEWARQDMFNRSLLFIPMLWAFYSLLLIPFREKKYYWFYPVTILYLLPISLIEPRYLIVPVVLFTLFRKPTDERLEYLTAAIYIPFTLFLFIGTAAEEFFI